MEMSQTNITMFRNAFNSKMKELEAEFGVKVNLGNISYNNAGFHTKMEVKNLDLSTGTVMINPRNESAAKRAFVAKFGSDILSDGIIGKRFHLWNGGVITITDFDTKKPKYPILYEKDGKRFKCSVSSIEGRA